MSCRRCCSPRRDPPCTCIMIIVDVGSDFIQKGELVVVVSLVHQFELVDGLQAGTEQAGEQLGGQETVGGVEVRDVLHVFPGLLLLQLGRGGLFFFGVFHFDWGVRKRSTLFFLLFLVLLVLFLVLVRHELELVEQVLEGLSEESGHLVIGEVVELALVVLDRLLLLLFLGEQLVRHH